ncbi:MAG: cell division protein FtsH, partial [Frankiales bacterium]|nr:cell division protein FtsH [Frankiales bacterium]
MNLKRYARGPALYIGLGLILVLAVSSGLRGNGGYSKSNTATVLSHIAAGDVVDNPKANKLLDKEQLVKVQLKGEDGKPGKKLEASYLIDQGRDFASAFKTAKTRYDVTVSHQSLLISLLVGLLPFILIFGVFFLVMNQMQGGGSRVMQFGKSKAKLVSKD